MIEKIFTMSIFLFLLVISGCSVNNSTGLITVENRTNVALTNVMIGSTSISLIVFPGQKTDYYYFQTISGKLSTLGVPVDNSTYFDINANNSKDSGEGVGEVNYSIKTNYWVKIYATTSTTSGKKYINFQVGKQDGSMSSFRDYLDY